MCMIVLLLNSNADRFALRPVSQSFGCICDLGNVSIPFLIGYSRKVSFLFSSINGNGSDYQNALPLMSRPRFVREM